MKTKEDDKRFIRDSQKWPGPFLPVKNPKHSKPGDWPDFGIMLRGIEWNIYEDDQKTIKKEYKNLDELLDDGWMVD